MRAIRPVLTEPRAVRHKPDRGSCFSEPGPRSLGSARLVRSWRSTSNAYPIIPFIARHSPINTLNVCMQHGLNQLEGELGLFRIRKVSAQIAFASMMTRRRGSSRSRARVFSKPGLVPLPSVQTRHCAAVVGQLWLGTTFTANLARLSFWCRSVKTLACQDADN